MRKFMQIHSFLLFFLFAASFGGNDAARAATILEPFSITVTGYGAYDGVYAGMLTYDDSYVSPGPDSVISPDSGGVFNGLLGLSFDTLDESHNPIVLSMTDDVDYPEYPQVSFFLGFPVGIDFETDEPDMSLHGLLYQMYDGKDLLAQGKIRFGAIPEPGTVWLFVAGLGGLGLLRWRRK